MSKWLTITISNELHAALREKFGPRRISKGIEQAFGHHVGKRDLDAEYRAMAQDEEREREATEWLEALAGETLPDDDFKDWKQ